jgi:cell division protein FtsI (penicillin-binding protein 3)
VSTTSRGHGAGGRSTGRTVGRAPAQRPAPPRVGEGPFVPRRAPGTRRSGAGLSMDQRGMRNRWGLIVMITLLVLVVGRLAVLQGVDGAAYASAAEQDRLRTHPIAALRGQVLDRNGHALAYTVDASRVVADPTVIENPARAAHELGPLLDVPEADLTGKLSQDGRYVVLASQVPPQTVDAIKALKLPGVLFEDDPVRLYPAGTVGGQVVGFIGKEGAGLAGIEQTFDDELAGTPGERRVEVGSGGNPIPSGIDESTPATDGSAVTLTLDEDLQYVTEKRLGEACADGDTTQGSAVVLDVKTGQIMAMGSCPGFNPAEARKTDPDRLGNPAVSDVFEPGSVMKAVTVSAALEEGVAHPDSVLTVDGKIDAGDHVVRDSHDHGPIDYTVTGIIAKSSNVGTIMLAREIGDEKLEHYMRAFGIGSTTGVELPGESRGILEGSADWTASRAANVPIGQGVSVTTLQLASIYQTIANDGVRIPPRIVRSVTSPDGTAHAAAQAPATRVVSASTAADMRYMLEAVVGEGGTAPRGAIEGFRVAGKTGTAQRPNPDCGCYRGGGYVTSFVGFAPADHPRYVVAVDLERPTGAGDGGGVAAPVFADVMRYALTAAGVVPSGSPRPDFTLTATP